MKLFKQTLKVSAIGALTACIAFGMMDAKADDLGSTVTAVVNNAISITEVQALDFGEFVAVWDAGSTSTIAISATTGTPAYGNPGAARITEITAGDRGIFDVAAAPNADLTITLPADGAVVLACGACTGTNEDFALSSWTSDPAAGSITTDAAGDVQIGVGATLTTSTVGLHEDGSYSAPWTFTINY